MIKLRSIILCVFSLILILVSVPYRSSADPLDNWHWRSPLPQSNYNLFGVSYGNGIFVTVGYVAYETQTGLTVDGIILSSSDGAEWASRKGVGSSNPLYGVAYGEGIFVAVGDNGTILTSTDGVTWMSRSSGTTESLSGVIYSNGIFVAGVSNGAVLTSTDGIAWMHRDLEILVSFNWVTHGNGTFVAVGESGTIFTSLDGLTWTARESGTAESLNWVAYGDGIFVAVGASYCDPFGYFGCHAVILTSSDGVEWTLRTTPGSDSLVSVSYGDGIFIAVGRNGTILTSPDAVTWTSRNAGTNDDLGRITCGNGTFVVIGNVHNYFSFILQSDFLSGNCTATLSSNLSLHVPIINFNGTYLQGDATCQKDADGSIMCRVESYSSANPSDFSDCQASTLTSNFKLHVPAGIYNNISYQADFESSPSTDGQLWFKLVSAIKN